VTHTHDGHTHSHVPEGEISLKSLMVLGASGGLVPCPSALVLLLSAISIGRTGFGLLLLLSFSLGLALVLMATGLVVLYAKNLFPERKGGGTNPFFRVMPIISAAVILAIGIVLTGNAVGVIPVIRFFG
jgi:nickel/cobalt exporter